MRVKFTKSRQAFELPSFADISAKHDQNRFKIKQLETSYSEEKKLMTTVYVSFLLNLMFSIVNIS